MNVKVKTEEKKEIFSLPSHIQSEVDEKWFFLYNWISSEDVKASIEKDFLNIINKIWWFLAVIVVILWVFTYWSIRALLLTFLSFVWFTSILILLFLSFIAAKRSKILSKNAFVVLTNNYVSLNWKILKYDEISKMQGDLKSIEKEFDESLFWESNLFILKSDLTKQIWNKLIDWYQKIWKFLWNRWSYSNDSSKTLILVYGIYTFYAIFMWIVYFVWTFFLWIFTLFLNFINKFILKIKWQEVISINSMFNKIDSNSNILNNEKNNLTKNLLKAKNNEWQDALLLNINSWINKITKESNIAVNNSLSLEKKLKDSKYNDFFDFSIYNSWIKKQIYDPLQEIKNILEKNLEVLIKTKSEIISQTNSTKEVWFKAALESQTKRLEMRIEDMKSNINLIKSYMEKIKI